jgi:hypothetical protein
MLESPASCFAFRYGASLNMTTEEEEALPVPSLSTHVLDTMRGIPAPGMTMELWSIGFWKAPVPGCGKASRSVA